ncbi:MAG: hypothetical protein RIF41_16120, partial [Polyangiaceae bacterium]
MAEPGDIIPHQDILERLDETSLKRRDGERRIGRKAYVLGRLMKGGAPVPPAWVLPAEWFERFVARCLPRRHDLKSLIRLSGTKAGDERCARAYEEMRAEPIP